jgi:glutamyl endopeptidase
MTFPNGQRFSGTGTLIGKSSVLTAGHNVYSEENGGWVDQVEIFPGLDGTFMPFGRLFGSGWGTFKPWKSRQDPRYNIAHVDVDEIIGDTAGWLGVGKTNGIVGMPATLAGYPTDRDDGTFQYSASGPIGTANQDFLTYSIDADDAQTGGAIQRVVGDKVFVAAVHTGSVGGQNRGVRLNAPRLKIVRQWGRGQ